MLSEKTIGGFQQLNHLNVCSKMVKSGFMRTLVQLGWFQVTKNLLKLDNVSINIYDNHHSKFCHIRPPNWHIDSVIVGNIS